MPLVAHNNLPTFERLAQEGQTILRSQHAQHQDIREQHIGLLNMMPDAALAATERQFFRMVGESNPIIQIYMHVFTLPILPRSEKAQAYIDQHYESFESLQEQGLDALIITGANVTEENLADEPFWQPLIEVVEWAKEHVTSTLCSCLATHAVMEASHGKKRRHLKHKRWGVFPHHITQPLHPLVRNINTRFDVPHSRFNQVDTKQFVQAGTTILAASDEAGVQLAVSEDGLRIVYFQGHPEYDAISLLKEYKREVMLFYQGVHSHYPPFPAHYFDTYVKAICDEYQQRLMVCKEKGEPMPLFPEALIAPRLHNTWHDTGSAIVNNWLGLVYQCTNPLRGLPLMEGIDPDDPLGIKEQLKK